MERTEDRVTSEARRATWIPVHAAERRCPRYALSLAITMEGENNFYAGLSEDISEGGVFIATHHVLPIGTHVALSFTLPTSNASLSVLGTVQWLRGPEATASWENVFGCGRELAGVVPGIGVKFQPLASAALDAIRDFIRHRSPAFFDA